MNEKYKVGMEAKRSMVVTTDMVEAYARIVGDQNPVHLDREYAEATVFKKPIAHGMLTASLFSGIFGCDFPGEGSIYIKQNLNFKKPVYIDEEVVSVVKIQAIDVEKKRLIFSTVATVNGVVVVDGDAVILVQEL